MCLYIDQYKTYQNLSSQGRPEAKEDTVLMMWPLQAFELRIVIEEALEDTCTDT